MLLLTPLALFVLISSLTTTLSTMTPAATNAAQQAPPPRAPSAPAPPQIPTSIVIEPMVVELGAVKPGSTHPAKFILRNIGTKPVRVLDAVPNCKCTAITPVKGKIIEPGATLELSASLAAPRAPGIKEASVLLAFDQSPPIGVKIRGDVQFPVIAVPPYADALKEVVRGTIKLSSQDGQPFRVTRSGTKAPVFVGFDPAKDAPRASYEIVWDLAGVPCETMPLWWFVWTDRVDCPVIPLRVRDECTGSKADMARAARFWISKEQLVDAGNASVGKAHEVEIDLEHYNPPKKGAVERPDWRTVKSVRSLSPLCEATFISTRDVGSDGVMVKISVTAKTLGPIEGELEIETATGIGRVPFTVHGVS